MSHAVLFKYIPYKGDKTMIWILSKYVQYSDQCQVCQLLIQLVTHIYMYLHSTEAFLVKKDA